MQEIFILSHNVPMFHGLSSLSQFSLSYAKKNRDRIKARSTGQIDLGGTCGPCFCSGDSRSNQARSPSTKKRMS
jgi:hypothetical protein